MKVLMHSSFPFSAQTGVGRVILELSERLRSKGVEVDLLFGTSRTGNVSTYLDALNSPFTIIRHTPVSKLFFKNRIDHSEYDIIHSHTPESAYDSIFSFPKIAERTIVHLHGLDKIVHMEWKEEISRGTEKYNPVTEFYLKASMSRAQKIFGACKNFISVSENVAKDAQKEYNAKTEVIYNGFGGGAIQNSGKDLRSELGIPENSRVVLFVGTNPWRKGLSYLLDAMEILGNDFMLLAIGTKPPAKIPQNSIFLPEVEHGKIYGYFSISDVFCMPSVYEPFGIVYLEALNFGIPCVGCFGTGAEEIISDGKNGFLVEKRSPLGIADAIEKSQKLGGKIGFDRKKFNWDGSVKRLLSYYDKIN